MLGDNIRRIRKSRKISVNQLAKLSGISLGYISDLENNKFTNPSLEKLTKIAEVLNVPVNDLVQEVVLYDANDIKVSDISKVAPLIIDALSKASESDPEIARAIKETIKSKDKVFFLGDLIKRVMYDPVDDDLKIEFSENIKDNRLKGKIEEMIAKDSNNSFQKVQSFTSIPVLGTVRAGEPMFAEQNIITYLPIPDNQLNHGGEYFGLLVVGDSMNSSGILDGSYAVIRKQETVEDGEIAAVLIDGEEATIKTFYRTDTSVTLLPHSTNPDHKPKLIDLGKIDVKVLGKVVMVVKKL